VVAVEEAAQWRRRGSTRSREDEAANSLAACVKRNRALFVSLGLICVQILDEVSRANCSTDCSMISARRIVITDSLPSSSSSLPQRTSSISRSTIWWERERKQEGEQSTYVLVGLFHEANLSHQLSHFLRGWQRRRLVGVKDRRPQLQLHLSNTLKGLEQK